MAEDERRFKLLADATPVVYDQVLQEMPETQALLLAELLGNEVVKDFFDRQAKFARGIAMQMTPIGIDPLDYHGTMSHLWRVAGLWDEMKLLVEQCQKSLASRTAPQPQPTVNSNNQDHH